MSLRVRVIVVCVEKLSCWVVGVFVATARARKSWTRRSFSPRLRVCLMCLNTSEFLLRLRVCLMCLNASVFLSRLRVCVEFVVDVASVVDVSLLCTTCLGSSHTTRIALKSDVVLSKSNRLCLLYRFPLAFLSKSEVGNSLGPITCCDVRGSARSEARLLFFHRKLERNNVH